MSKKGSKEERDVVKIFEKFGYGAIRVPASGARTKSDKPDVIAGNGTEYYAVEVKSSKNDYIYIREEQMDELFRFSRKFGAVPWIVAKFTRKPYVVFNPHMLVQTKSGKYKIQRKYVHDETCNSLENVLHDLYVQRDIYENKDTLQDNTQNDEGKL